MTEMSLRQRIARRYQAGLQWVQAVSFLVKLVLVLGGALLAGLSKYLPLATTPFDYQAFLAICGVAAAFTGGALLLVLDKNLAGSAADAADALTELETVRGAARQLGALVSLAEEGTLRSRYLRVALVTMMKGLTEHADGARRSEEEMLSGLLDLGLDGLIAAIGFNADEVWTISVYRSEGDSPAMLRRVSTRRSNRLEETSSSRAWPSGNGHIGATHARAEEVVLPDVLEQGMAHALNTPKRLARQDDGDRYRSIAAVPVFHAGRSDPWGVVIGTSSKAGRFHYALDSEGWERAEAMRVLGAVVALGLAIHYNRRRPVRR